MPNTATPAQVELIKTLVAERVTFDAQYSASPAPISLDLQDMDRTDHEAFVAAVALREAREMWRRGWFDKATASALIERLKKCRVKPRIVVPSGRYAIVGHSGHLAFYRVTDSGAVFLQVSDGATPLGGVSARSVVETIAADPEAASRAYGREIGSCGVCGRTLTNAESRAAGIGPVCAEKF